MLHQLKISIPDTVYQRLRSEAKRQSKEINEIVQTALEKYTEGFDITQTRTWKLAGTLAVKEPDPVYTVSAGKKAVTNYAEHIDDVLYKADEWTELL
jgi:metal-responsive CopG/Arc/MetJ family transcriptional regulator